MIPKKRSTDAAWVFYLDDRKWFDCWLEHRIHELLAFHTDCNRGEVFTSTRRSAVELRISLIHAIKQNWTQRLDRSGTPHPVMHLSTEEFEGYRLLQTLTIARAIGMGQNTVRVMLRSNPRRTYVSGGKWVTNR